MKERMKKWLVIFMAGCMAAGLAACGSKETVAEENTSVEGQTDSEEIQEPIRIGVTLMNFQTEFSIGLKDYLEEKAEEIGGVELNIVDAQGDAARQVQQVESFIGQQVDAIILQPQEQEASSPCVDKAKEAGIPIVNVNSLTTSEPDAYVGSDDIEAAEIAMNYIAEQLGGEGNVLMMHGHAGQTAEVKRTEGAKEVLEQYRSRQGDGQDAEDFLRQRAHALKVRKENGLLKPGEEGLERRVDDSLREILYGPGDDSDIGKETEDLKRQKEEILKNLNRLTDFVRDAFGEDLELAEWLRGIENHGDAHALGFSRPEYAVLLDRKGLEAALKEFSGKGNAHLADPNRNSWSARKAAAPPLSSDCTRSWHN